MTQQKRQDGYLYKRNGGWHVRYREQARAEDGTVKSVQRSQRIASVHDYPRKSEVVPLQQELMSKLNKIGFTPEKGVTLVEFAENVYFPAAERQLAGSTVKGYRDAWRCHIKPNLTPNIRVRDFRTVDGEMLMRKIEQLSQSSVTPLAHATFRWIKSTASAIFTHARRVGVLDGNNPIQGVSVPKGRAHGRSTRFYSLEEIERALSILPEPARTVVAVAGFTGLREGEIRGLRWEDYDAGEFRIQRTVWRVHVQAKTKTGEDAEAPGIVPVILPLRELLTGLMTTKTAASGLRPSASALRAGNPLFVPGQEMAPAQAFGYVFPNSKGGPLSLNNLVNRVIRPLFQAHGLEWKGWHAFRRGLATNLKRLGVPDTTIQAILRHSSVKVTQQSYIKTAREDVTAAMQQLEDKLKERRELIN